jgi:hypothetical protein
MYYQCENNLSIIILLSKGRFVKKNKNTITFVEDLSSGSCRKRRMEESSCCFTERSMSMGFQAEFDEIFMRFFMRIDMHHDIPHIREPYSEM